MKSRPGLPTASLFIQVLALVLVSLSAAQLITVLVIFNLPRPDPDLYRLTEVESAMATGAPGADPRPLVTTIRPRPPADGLGSPVRVGVEQRIARDLSVVPQRVSFLPEFRDNPLIRLGPQPARRSDPRSMAEQIRRDRLRFVELATTEGGGKQAFLTAPFKVALELPDGRWRVVQPKPLGLLDPWQQRVALWFLLTALAMAPVAYLFARRLASPFSAFAQAAERLGRDPGGPALELKGSAEIKVAANAFNEMQRRLRLYVQDRTTMIGAIAHDLRTPLTRLRFRIEAAPEDVRNKMERDIDQMEAMVAATLSFVRDASQPAARSHVELSSLLQSIVDELADMGRDVSLRHVERVIVDGDPLGLRRAVTNLIENALKFGVRARVQLRRDAEGQAVVQVDDDGPGLSASDLERVFEPFYRTEPSRSRDTGGIGLGLAVARSIARAHGGDVELENRAEGGLAARLRLP